MLQKSISMLVIFAFGFYMGHNTKDYRLLLFFIGFDLIIVAILAAAKYVYNGI